MGGVQKRTHRALAALTLSLALIGCSTSSGGETGSSGSTTRGAAPTTAATTATPPAELTVSFTGDILAHSPVYRQAATDAQASGRAYDFRPMFALVKPLLSASDLAICHQETPLSADDSTLSGYPVFNSPHEIADAVADAGYDGCSTASNHSYDHGAAGVTRTLAAFDTAKVEHTGTARSAAEAARPEFNTVRGTKVALLDYTYGLNGLKLPASQPYLVNLTNVPRILRDAHAARAAGAQIVIVQMHWGTENQSAPTDEQRAQAREILASPDVDAIVGGHVHVVQPVEKIGSKYVVYGVGNFLSNQSADCCPAASEDGVIATLHFHEVGNKWTVGEVSYTPTYVDRTGGYVILPVDQVYTDPDTSPALKQALASSWQRTVSAITQLHAPGVTPDNRPPGL